jgi:hypothetical protein
MLSCLEPFLVNASYVYDSREFGDFVKSNFSGSSQGLLGCNAM